MKYRQLIDFHRRKIAFKKKRYLKKKLPGLYMSILPTLRSLSKAGLLQTCQFLRQISPNSSYCFPDRASEPAE